MTSLREAREKGQLDQLIAEHEASPPGDMDSPDAVIKQPHASTG